MPHFNQRAQVQVLEQKNHINKTPTSPQRTKRENTHTHTHYIYIYIYIYIHIQFFPLHSTQRKPL
jgi:hypothetical protein